MKSAKKLESRKPTAVNGITPLIGIPWERSIAHASEVHPWLLGIAQQGFPFIGYGYDRTDVQRNEFAEHLLGESQFSHLVMLDLDHRHPYEAVMQLCASVAEDEARQVVAALSFRRGEPYEPLMYRLEDDRLISIVEWEPGEVLEVDATGTGAIIISREVFEALPWPWFKYEYPERGHYPTEDTFFCKLCKEHGIPMHVDTRIRNDHLMTVGVNEEFFRAYVAERMKQEA